MLLVEFIINDVLNYLSMEGIALTHWWKNKIIGFDPPQMAIAFDYGGYFKPSYGSISFFPDLFDDDWPPPVNGGIAVKYTDSTEGAAEKLFQGMAHLEDISRSSITYGLYGRSFDEEIAGATAYNDTLNNVLTTILMAIAEINAVDTTFSRDPSPNVLHTTVGDKLNIELASGIAAFYSHMIYIVDATAFLIDMLDDAGTETITEFDIYPSSYPYNPPISSVKAGTFYKNSLYPYGKELSVTQYHDTEANVITALTDILTVVNLSRIKLKRPFVGSQPLPGKALILTDESQGQSTDIKVRTRIIKYDFNNEEITIEGEGIISAT